MRVDVSQLIKTTPIERALDGYVSGSRRRVLALTDGMVGVARMWGETDQAYGVQWITVEPDGRYEIWDMVDESSNMYERWWWK